MTADSGARSEILRRIAAARHGRGASALADMDLAWHTLPRLYRQTGGLTSPEKLVLFEHRLRDYGASVEHCALADVASALSGLLQRRAAHRLALPNGFPAGWLPSGPEWLDADLLDADALDQCDGVLTGATLAIAETGTVVLQSGPGQGRRAVSLVPDYHVCVVRVTDLVQTVPEALRRLQETATLPTTFISGPSATADIEMTRIKGVHGPRFLDVLLAG